MTKSEFCKKWQRGWRAIYNDGTQAYFFNEESMMQDLNLVIHSEVLAWKKFVDKHVELTIERFSLLERKIALV